ncbi:polyprenyl synthetase family protein [Candidatus Woesearchaeota archaeon]|nr:polyprenyl synthetase family protein [Candidatus Woesearchaeota archaeon]
MLDNYKQLVNKELDLFFKDKLEKADQIDPSSKQMIELLREFTMRGGKRLRAALVYHGYKCFSNKNLKEIIKASMTMELIQSYLLIHDDIIDNDDLRRNGPTLHISYKNIAKRKYKKIDSNHFGISMAILAGDICAAFANEIIAKLKIKEKYKTPALSVLNHSVHHVIYGQALDILSELRTITNKDIEKIHRLKTATYTIESPLKIGALLAGAKQKHLNILSRYAILLGKAFQIKDDILGMFGEKQKVGKPVDSDLKEGKKNLLILKALENATPAQKQQIQEALGNPDLTKNQLNQVRAIIIKTGSLSYSQNLAKKLVQKAKSAIKSAKLKPEGKKFLFKIADYIEQREC